MKPKIRSDLIYKIDEADDSYFFVKDPVRAQFYRFNELQVEMMRALDGERTADEIAEGLSEEIGMEISGESVRRLIARLESEFLLDVSSYRLTAEEDRRLVRKYLRRRGIQFRGQRGGREINQEMILFEEGIRQIETGDPCEAAQCFQEVLKLNPNNDRAKQVLDTLHVAFFRRHQVQPSHLVMFHLFNPDKLLTWIDLRFGKFLLSKVGVGLMVAVMIFAASTIPDLNVPPMESFGFEDLAWFYVLYAISHFIHEMAHGLVCKHYGGTVNDMGGALFYFVWPAAYCDTSDTYLFPKAKHRIHVQIAGVFSNFVASAILLLIFHNTSDAFFLRNAIGILLISYSFDTYSNLNPLAKLDGYYALSEAVGIRNLRERSFKYCWRQIERSILGIERPNEEEPSPHERRVFLTYGISAGLYTAALLYFLWISFVLPKMIEYLGTLGIFFTILWAASFFYKRTFIPLLKISKILYTHRRQIFTLTRTAIFASVIALSAGIFSIRWPYYVDAVAVVEPESKAVIYAHEEGLIERINVREGEEVRAGTSVAALENEELDRVKERIVHTLSAAKQRLAEMTAGARPEQVALMRARVARAQVESRYAQRNEALREQLQKENIVSSATADEARREAMVTSALRDEAASSLALVQAGNRVEDVTQAEAELKKLEAQLLEVAQRREKLQVKAPIDGVIVGRALDELRHKRFVKGEPICEVHDLSRIRLEMVFKQSDLIAPVEVGQKVVARPYGDPNTELWTVVERVQPSARADGSIVVFTVPASNPGWLSGMTATARVYGRPRSIAFRVFGAPIMRLLSYDAWRFIGGGS